MTTKEIVKTLPKNKLIRAVVPDWAHPTIPFPFFRNGIPCLGIYFYPIKSTSGKHQIEAPIVQIIIAYPTGHIVGITASPFFMERKEDATLVLGEYPNAFLKSLSLDESNRWYDEYYTACDLLFERKDYKTWKLSFSRVMEEGMDRFFSLFSSNKIDVTDKQHEQIQSKRTPDSSSSNQRPQVSAKTRHILRDIQTFLEKPYFSKELSEFKKSVVECSRQDYNVAVIGEFSRGKSTFLNKLLGINYLPVGDLPTTAVLTRISNASSVSAVFVDKTKTTKRVDIQNNGLEQFLADDQGKDPEGVLQVSLPIDWLEDQKIVFFDTPGAGDIIGKRADITRNTIGHCDCTIIAISAQAPCSLTELEFLKETVLLKAVPRCYVAITKLDTIPKEERGRIISYIQNKIKVIVPNAEFWVENDVSGIDDSILDAYGIQNIRSRILSISSSDNEVNRLREQQLISQVQLVLDKAKTEVRLVEEAEKLSDEGKNKAIKQLEHNKEHLQLVKEELLVIGDKLKYSTDSEIISDLEDIQKDLLKDCRMSLQKAGMVKDWVEKDFPYIVEKSMKSIAARMEKKAICSISASRTELGKIVKERLSCSGITVELPSYESIPLTAEINFAPENLDKTRMLTRCATIISVPFALFFLGPFGTLVSGGLGLGSELLLKGKIEEQKRIVSEHLEIAMWTMFEEFKKNMHNYIEKCYAEIIDATNKESEKAISNAISKIQSATCEHNNQCKESSSLTCELDSLISSLTNNN